MFAAMKVLVGLLIVGVVAARQERCPANQHYNSCGSACPLTCDNVDNPPKFCVLVCSPGCHCDEGYVRTDAGQCVRPRECPKARPAVSKTETSICELSAKSGNCRARFIRYYFDKFSGQCKKFIYGGCGGNKNNFRTLDQCNQKCEAKGDRRTSINGAVETEIIAVFKGKTPKQLQAMYREIKKKNYQEGVDTTTDQTTVCLFIPDSGMCDIYTERYYYDKSDGRCKRFLYGGCGGNKNNFPSEDECNRVCTVES